MKFANVVSCVNDTRLLYVLSNCTRDPAIVVHLYTVPKIKVQRFWTEKKRIFIVRFFCFKTHLSEYVGPQFLACILYVKESNQIKCEPAHDKTTKIACAPREDSDQPGHPPSLISLRCALSGVAKDPNFLHTDSEYLDQTGRMPRLTWDFAWRTCHFVGFVVRWLMYTQWLTCLFNPCPAE